jgi:hypothetical protein
VACGGGLAAGGRWARERLVGGAVLPNPLNFFRRRNGDDTPRLRYDATLPLYLCHGSNAYFWSGCMLLGNSGKPVTLATLSLTKFLRHVFQEQGTHDFRRPGICEASDSRICEVRGS